MNRTDKCHERLSRMTPEEREAYCECVTRRKEFSICKYKTLDDVDLDGPWVTPQQITSCSMTGPVLVGHHWLDAKSVEDAPEEVRNELKEKGYLPKIAFNKVLDLALERAGLTRSDIYVTQAFHLLPPDNRTQSVPPKYLYESFKRITHHEVEGRAVIALGAAAERACRRGDVKRFVYFKHVIHPSARGRNYKSKAAELAEALKEAKCAAEKEGARVGRRRVVTKRQLQ